MNWIEVSPKAAPSAHSLFDASEGLELTVVVEGGRAAVNIPYLSRGSDKSTIGFASTTSIFRQFRLVRLLHADAAQPAGSQFVRFLRTLRTLQRGPSQPTQDARLDSLESLINGARLGPVTIGTSGGRPVILGTADLRILDEMQLALEEPVLSLSPTGLSPLGLFDQLNGTASVVGETAAYIMNAAQSVAGIPSGDQVEAAGWISLAAAFLANRTPGANAAPIGAAVVVLLGRENARRLGGTLTGWAASRSSPEPALDFMDGVAELNRLARSDFEVPDAGTVDSGAPDSGIVDPCYDYWRCEAASGVLSLLQGRRGAIESCYAQFDSQCMADPTMEPLMCDSMRHSLGDQFGAIDGSCGGNSVDYPSCTCGEQCGTGGGYDCGRSADGWRKTATLLECAINDCIARYR